MHIYIYITNDSSFLGEKVNLFFPGYGLQYYNYFNLCASCEEQPKLIFFQGLETSHPYVSFQECVSSSLLCLDVVRACRASTAGLSGL